MTHFESAMQRKKLNPVFLQGARAHSLGLHVTFCPHKPGRYRQIWNQGYFTAKAFYDRIFGITPRVKTKFKGKSYGKHDTPRERPPLSTKKIQNFNTKHRTQV